MPHNLEVAGSNPVPATRGLNLCLAFFYVKTWDANKLFCPEARASERRWRRPNVNIFDLVHVWLETPPTDGCSDAEINDPRSQVFSPQQRNLAFVRLDGKQRLLGPYDSFESRKNTT